MRSPYSVQRLDSRYSFISTIAIAILVLFSASPIFAQRQMENLGRGVVAVRNANDVFISWRLLGFEPQETAFNVYRSPNGGPLQKLNSLPLTAGTNFVDASANHAVPNTYFVNSVVNGVELSSGAGWTLPANSTSEPLFRIPLQAPANRRVENVSIGDLDGDGEYEFVLTYRGAAPGQTHKIQTYKRDGTLLWEVDFGPNSVDSDNIYVKSAPISVGQWDGVAVFDLDGDGKAEVIAKTANGVTFGNGAVLTYGDDLTQFISIIDGLTGAERARAELPNPWKTRPQTNRPLGTCFGIGYADGVRPSLFIHAKNRNASESFNLIESAWDYRDGVLSQRWSIHWDGDGGNPPENAHGIRVVDVDGDGKDDLLPGMHVVSSGGTLLYDMGDRGIVHGDRFHVTDLDPNRPGLEGYGIQQNNRSGIADYSWDPATGELLWVNNVGNVVDAARGTSADIDPRFPGMENWSFYGVRAANGTLVYPEPKRPWPNLAIWWDGDLLGDNLNVANVDKWNYGTQTTSRLLTAGSYGTAVNSRSVPQFIGDIIGDWREEIILERSNHQELLVFTTNVPSEHRIYTLAHNPAYRNCLTTKGYLQQNLPDYFLGDGMAPPPRPNIVPVVSATSLVPAITVLANDTGASNIDNITNNNRPVLKGKSTPNAQIIISRIGSGEDGVATADGTGSWTFSYSAPLADGTHYFAARLSGQTQLSLPFAVLIDTVPPPSPVVHAVVADGSGGLNVIGTADAGLRIDGSISSVGSIGTTSANATGNWQLAYAPTPASASYTVAVTTMDVAGNVSAPTNHALNLTLVTPAITAVSDDTGISSTDHITSDNTLTLSGTAGSGAGVEIYRIGSGLVGFAQADQDGAWNFNYNSVLADGEYVFTAYAGQSLGAPAFVVKVDRVSPSAVSIERVSPAAASSSATSVVIRVTFSDSVNGVDQTDFTAVFGGGLSGLIEGVAAIDAANYDVTVGSLSGPGTLGLDLKSSGTGIGDYAGNSIAGGLSSGPIFTRILIGNGTWIRPESDGLWSDSANWTGGIVADGGANMTGNFNTLNITQDQQVNFDSPRTLTNLIFGDTDVATAAGWTVTNDGNSANTLTLVSGTATPAITVNALGTGKTVVLDVPLAGSNGFNKVGTGTLSLTTANTLTGNVGVSAGILRVESEATLTPGSVNVSNSGSSFRVTGGSVQATGTANISSAGVIIVDAGLAQFPSIAGGNESGNTIRVNGGTFITNSISFERSNASISYSNGFIVTGGQAQVGSITLGTNNSHAMMSVEGGVANVSGALRLGQQSTGGRGGHLRVTGGVFNSTDASATGGLIISARNNNTSTANFLGGVSTVERISFGLTTLTAGSGTLILNGGSLYVGSSGIAKNGGGTFTAAINLTSGVLGAKGAWSTDLPVTLLGGGNITLKTAAENGDPFSVTLGGIISGAGGFTKSGGGTLTLSAVNTFTGDVSVNAGTLLLGSGSGLSTGALTINTGGKLTGNGTTSRAVVLKTGSTVAPGISGAGALSATSLTWHGGGRLEVDIGASTDVISLTGALTKGSAGSYEIAFNSAAGLAPGSYTLATFGSTTFSASDFTATGLGDVQGHFVVDGDSLEFVVDGAETVNFSSWIGGYPAVGAQTAPSDDPDGDGVVNQLEFLLGLDPSNADASGLPSGKLENGMFAFRFIRDKTANATFSIERSIDLVNWTEVAATVEASTAANETLVRLEPLTESKLFLRLTSGGFSTTPVGYMTANLLGGKTTTIGLPFDDTGAALTGISSGAAQTVSAHSFTHGSGGWTQNLASPSAPWAVRFTSGVAAGKLFDVSTNTLNSVTVGTANLLSAGVVAGDRFELVALDTLATFFGPSTVQGSTSAASADVVQLRSGATWIAYYYDTALGYWRRTSGAATNSDNTIIRPGSGMMILRRGSSLSLTIAGKVLGTTFRVPINNASTTGIHSGYPLDTTLGTLGLQNLVSGWRAGVSTNVADSIGLYNGSAWTPYVFNGTNWQTTSGINSDSLVIPAGAVLLIQRPGSTSGTTDLVRSKAY